MWAKRVISTILCGALLASIIVFPVNAVERATNLDNKAFDSVIPFATNSFSMSIPANSIVAAESSFSLATGETVTFNASYSPFQASVDFGLVNESGVFYFFNVTDGSINKTMQVSKSGKYTFVVRNNSSTEVAVTGFINY